MHDKFLVDLRYLIDLSKIEVSVEVSNCIENQYKSNTIERLIILLCFAKENVFYLAKNINITVFNSLLNKLKQNKKYLYELDVCVSECKKRLTENTNLNESDYTKVIIPRKSFKITLQELLIFYNLLEWFENHYSIIRNNLLEFSNEKSYYNNINAIKNMLEKRLAYAIINIKMP